MVNKLYLYLLIFLIFCFSVSAHSTELIFPALKAESGQTITVPVVIDHIDNMAGIKLSLEYDKKILSFQKGEKTKVTGSLMHIINDKKPGKLIIVMAGARGVEVKNFPIIYLYFKINDITQESVSTSFVVKEIQLMSDTLKEIDCTIKPGSIVVKKSKNRDKPKNKKVLKEEDKPKKPDNIQNIKTNKGVTTPKPKDTQNKNPVKENSPAKSSNTQNIKTNKEVTAPKPKDTQNKNSVKENSPGKSSNTQNKELTK